ASVKGYSKKMDVYYLYFSIFYFLQKRKEKKTENSIKIRATLVHIPLVFFIVLLFLITRIETIRTYLQRADRLFLIQNRKQMVRLKQAGLYWSLIETPTTKVASPIPYCMTDEGISLPFLRQCI
ncbi:hypothetical protein LSPCS325_43370, partial [Lysinibacillus sp. CTST325]